MKNLLLSRRSLALLAVIVPLLGLFIYVGLRSGPLAPIAVTVSTVESRAISPALFGIGTIEARYTYKIGPTFAGRLLRLDVEVGDTVTAGQVLGEMDSVDLDDRIRSQEAQIRRAQSGYKETQARQAYAQSQMQRYEKLFAAKLTSEEIFTTRKQELQISNAALSSAREELSRSIADRDAVLTLRNNLRLITPADGIVVSRDADPGTTVVAGQSIIEVIDPKSLWVNLRLDQINATGLAAGLSASIKLRSRKGEQALSGKILRVEPKADAVTEELLAKIVFDDIPKPLPPIAELAEVTIALATLSPSPSIPNAAIKLHAAKLGVWQVVDGKTHFSPIVLGVSDLDGYVQVKEGLDTGDSFVLYSEKALSSHSRIHIVQSILGVTP
jgi:RND family efflux transporter MFP subunit